MAFEFYDGMSELIANLDYAGGATGSYWHMLKHAERGGFDLAVLKPAIHSTLSREWTWNDHRFDDAEERELVLDLRDRMRLEMFMAPLDALERAAWRWEAPAGLRRYRYTGPSPMNDAPRLTPGQIDAIAADVRARYPEVIRYLRSVWEQSEGLGYNGGPYDKYIVRQTWHSPLLGDSICAVIGDSGEIWVWENVIEEALVLREGYG